MKCTKCGTRLSDSAKFCPECGAKVVGAAAKKQDDDEEMEPDEDEDMEPDEDEDIEPDEDEDMEPDEDEDDEDMEPDEDEPTNKLLKIVDGILFSCDASATGEIVVPASIRQIAITIEDEDTYDIDEDDVDTYGFSECEKITSITIPKSVKKFGDCAFSYCKRLKEIRYKGTMDDWNEIEKGEGLFKGSRKFERIVCSDGEIEPDEEELLD